MTGFAAWHQGTQHISGEGAHVKNDDRFVIFLAEAEGGGVHDLELTLEAFLERNAFEAGRIWIFDGIGVVDAVDLGRVEDDIGADLTSAQGGGGVHEGEGLAVGSAGEDPRGFFISGKRRAAQPPRSQEVIVRGRRLGLA